MCHGVGNIDKCITKESHVINVENTVKFINYLKCKNPKIIPVFFSTSMVYNRNVRYPKETSKISPVNTYGKQKLMVERYIVDNFRKAIILRLTKVFGVDKNDGTLFTKWIEKIICRHSVDVAIDYSISPIYVNDVVKATIQLMENDRYGIYNLGGDTEGSYFDFAKRFVSFLGKSDSLLRCISIKDLEIYQKRSKFNSVNSSKLMKTIKLNLTPIIRCFRAIKDNYNFN
jgi:dTDP-4-dehydrorhamnose reductase